GRAIDPWTDMLSDISRHPYEATLAITGVFLAVQAAWLFFALLILAWGARVEKLKASMSHALRRAWMQTSHLFWITAILGVVLIPPTWSEQRWHSMHRYPTM